MQIVRKRSYFIRHNFKLGCCLFCVFWLPSCCHKPYTIVLQQRAGWASALLSHGVKGFFGSSSENRGGRQEIPRVGFSHCTFESWSPWRRNATKHCHLTGPWGDFITTERSLCRFLPPQKSTPKSSALPGISLHSFLCHTYRSWRKSNKVLIPIGLIGVKLHHFSTASHCPSESSSINRGQ